jgi:DNA-binding GntR family transcriptional regulator
LAFSLASIQRHKSLQEQAYEALRTRILSGDLAPGQRLVETQLADTLKVSRTPIREAIRQLQRDTLVTADDRGNLRVTTISAEDAVHLYDCRIALERISVEGACQQATPQQLRDLVALVEKAEHMVDRKFNPFMLELDYQFHHQISECSGNPWLTGLLDQVFDKMTLLRAQTTRHDPQVLEIRCEHRAIYEAIAARKAAVAIAAIESHLVASRDRVVAAVKRIEAAKEE